jgi:hypothetical protein
MCNNKKSSPAVGCEFSIAFCVLNGELFDFLMSKNDELSLHGQQRYGVKKLYLMHGLCHDVRDCMR